MSRFNFSRFEVKLLLSVKRKSDDMSRKYEIYVVFNSDFVNGFSTAISIFYFQPVNRLYFFFYNNKNIRLKFATFLTINSGPRF